MNRDQFERRYAEGWSELETLLLALERRRKPADAERFPELYRRTCHHLALARARRYGPDLEQRLHGLALRGHQQLYRGAAASPWALAEGVRAGFPRRVRRELRLVAACFLLFALPLLGMSLAVRAEPDLVYTVLGPEHVAGFEQMYDPESPSTRGKGGNVMMFGYYVYNNIGIAFRTFASGIFLGLGSIFILVYNGVVMGTVDGHIANAGFGATFYPFVVGHSSFELIAIVLAGASGVRLGLAVLAPGRKSRSRSLREAARSAMPVLYGLTGMLVIAAFIEAFWSAQAIPPPVRYAAGAAGWAVVLGYFAFVGRGGPVGRGGLVGRGDGP